MLTAAERKAWLQSALAVGPGGKHKDLGKYRKQQFGAGFGWAAFGNVCPRCKLSQTSRGHDPCLANLPGVVNACCGHGMMPSWATLRSGFCLQGDALFVYLEKVGKLERFKTLFRWEESGFDRQRKRAKLHRPARAD